MITNLVFECYSSDLNWLIMKLAILMYWVRSISFLLYQLGTMSAISAEYLSINDDYLCPRSRHHLVNWDDVNWLP